MKTPQIEIAIKVLLDNRGEWLPSFKFIKADTKHGWLGTSIDRQLRGVAETGSYTLLGTKYFVERRHIGKYAEYRITGGTKEVSRAEIKTNPDGTRVAIIIKETIII